MVMPLKFPAAPAWIIDLAWWGGLALMGLGILYLLIKAVWIAYPSPWIASRNVSLRDAATKLYEAVRGTDIGRDFERRGAAEDEILDRAALHIFEHLPVEAKRPPSTKWELLTPAEKNGLMPRAGATRLGSLEGNDLIYTEPRLQRKDLWPLIRDYKAGARP
jgi:hypothetical protein